MIKLPESIVIDFDELWDSHPAERHLIRIKGNEVRVPRYQQAYGKDYSYSGNVNVALPMTTVYNELLEFVKTIEPKANGLLTNWYDSAEGHYIGSHSDSTEQLIPETNIVTISFGCTRIMKLKSKITKEEELVELNDRDVFVLNYRKNMFFTHEILKPVTRIGKRISVTFRAFKD